MNTVYDAIDAVLPSSRSEGIQELKDGQLEDLAASVREVYREWRPPDPSRTAAVFPGAWIASNVEILADSAPFQAPLLSSDHLLVADPLYSFFSVLVENPTFQAPLHISDTLNYHSQELAREDRLLHVNRAICTLDRLRAGVESRVVLLYPEHKIYRQNEALLASLIKGILGRGLPEYMRAHAPAQLPHASGIRGGFVFAGGELGPQFDKYANTVAGQVAKDIVVATRLGAVYAPMFGVDAEIAAMAVSPAALPPRWEWAPLQLPGFRGAPIEDVIRARSEWSVLSDSLEDLTAPLRLQASQFAAAVNDARQPDSRRLGAIGELTRRVTELPHRLRPLFAPTTPVIGSAVVAGATGGLGPAAEVSLQAAGALSISGVLSRLGHLKRLGRYPIRNLKSAESDPGWPIKREPDMSVSITSLLALVPPGPDHVA